MSDFPTDSKNVIGIIEYVFTKGAALVSAALEAKANLDNQNEAEVIAKLAAVAQAAGIEIDARLAELDKLREASIAAARDKLK